MIYLETTNAVEIERTSENNVLIHVVTYAEGMATVLAISITCQSTATTITLEVIRIYT